MDYFPFAPKFNKLQRNLFDNLMWFILIYVKNRKVSCNHVPSIQSPSVFSPSTVCAATFKILSSSRFKNCRSHNSWFLFDQLIWSYLPRCASTTGTASHLTASSFAAISERQTGWFKMYTFISLHSWQYSRKRLHVRKSFSWL